MAETQTAKTRRASRKPKPKKAAQRRSARPGSHYAFALSDTLQAEVDAANPSRPHWDRFQRTADQMQNTSQDPWVSANPITHQQAHVLELLVTSMGAGRCLDIGTFNGFSACVMAEAMGPKGRVHTFEVNPVYAALAHAIWTDIGIENRILQRHGEEDLGFFEGPLQRDTFDLAFIDADKRDHWSWYELCYPLLRRNGLMVFDNTGINGWISPDEADHRVPMEDADQTRVDEIVNFNRKVQEDERTVAVMLPIADGLTVVRKVWGVQ